MTSHGIFWTALLVFLKFWTIPIFCEAQGRLIEPPSRASMWRFGFRNPVDYKDDLQNCGGFQVQWRVHGGRCGVCGDPWDLPSPRPHEARGRYGRNGVIVKFYTQGQPVKVVSELTGDEDTGHMEYRLCPRASTRDPETPSCFSEPLKNAHGGTKWDVNITGGSNKVSHMLTLPPDLTCAACILQWRFVTQGARGREEYRACADVAILPDLNIATSSTQKPEAFSVSPQVSEDAYTTECPHTASPSPSPYSAFTSVVFSLPPTAISSSSIATPSKRGNSPAENMDGNGPISVTGNIVFILMSVGIAVLWATIM
ncbi:uncharacterized protein LOC122250767 [Penaeus japonicus]|uniref:uncharacterized protein LOC122250767 n=1 Tax=Penaeus japonicus TaxID=27405 RepID=UPI001C70C948|nr:uncharacterized protein LOC122250767 [Penaeus japonicus]